MATIRIVSSLLSSLDEVELVLLLLLLIELEATVSPPALLPALRALVSWFCWVVAPLVPADWLLLTSSRSQARAGAGREGLCP